MQANRGAVRGRARTPGDADWVAGRGRMSTKTLAEMHVALAVLYDNNGRYVEALVAAAR